MTVYIHKKNILPFPPLHDAGEDDVDVGVFGADPVLEAGGERPSFSDHCFHPTEVLVLVKLERVFVGV